MASIEDSRTYWAEAISPRVLSTPNIYRPECSMPLVLHYTHCKLFILIWKYCLINNIPFGDSLGNMYTKHRESVTRHSRRGNAATPRCHVWHRSNPLPHLADVATQQHHERKTRWLSRWCILVDNKKLWTIVLRIGTKQKQIPFLATVSAHI